MRGEKRGGRRRISRTKLTTSIRRSNPYVDVIHNASSAIHNASSVWSLRSAIARMDAMTKNTQTAAKKRANHCWPGYEPVPGKPQHTQGSCRPKNEKKLIAGEKKFRAARERQLRRWEAAHPGSPRKAAQHLHAPRATGGKKKGRVRTTAR